MNKIKYIICSIMLIACFYACDLLDLKPEDHYGSSGFWTNKAQVEGYALGLHGDLRSTYDMFFRLGEMRGGTSRAGTSSVNTSIDNSSPEKTNAFTYNNTGISNWYGLYNSIMNANHFIQKVEEECSFLTAEERAGYLAQAYGFRALYYTMLYKTFGGVPLVKTVKLLDGKVTAEKLYLKRSTAEETLTFIKEDLKKSEDYFGNNLVHNPIMWNKYTTIMLKADVYLWSAKVSTGDHQANTADLQIAKDALNLLVGKFTLLDNFSEIFSSKGNKEIVFAIRFADREATNFGNLFLYSHAVFVSQVYGRDDKLISTDTLNLKSTGFTRHEFKYGLFKSYDAADQRRDATFLDYYTKKSDGTVADYGLSMKKYIGSINSVNNRIYDTDIIVYRYADVLLMLAEIENMQGNNTAVKTYMDQIRKRAYGDNFTEAVAFTPGTFAENEKAILRERDKEFVAEGKRWFDVVRMHDASGKPLVFSADVNYKHMDSEVLQPILTEEKSYMILWPIAVTTLNNDPELVNNPGYEP